MFSTNELSFSVIRNVYLSPEYTMHEISTEHATGSCMHAPLARARDHARVHVREMAHVAGCVLTTCTGSHWHV
eukprot:COSAG02_NODE_736_length_17865_cov_9.190420_7_plen_73_part_00